MADSIAGRTPWSSIVRIAAIVVLPGEVTVSRSSTGCSLDAASMVAATTRVCTISSWATALGRPSRNRRQCPTQYGPGVRAVATYPASAQHLPLARTAQTLADLLGAPVSAGTVAAIVEQAAGADSIQGTDLLRHGANSLLFEGVRAPSTLGSFPRSFTFGHVRQLDAVASRFLAALAQVSPVLAGADHLAYVDIDDTVKATYGYAKQGAGYGYSGVKGLNALIATVSSPICAPVIVATRLRKGPAISARGAARLAGDALVTVKAAGAGGPTGAGLIVLRADSALCRRRHNADYAELLVMPRCVVKVLVAAGIGLVSSA